MHRLTPLPAVIISCTHTQTHTYSTKSPNYTPNGCNSIISDHRQVLDGNFIPFGTSHKISLFEHGEQDRIIREKNIVGFFANWKAICTTEPLSTEYN